MTRRAYGAICVASCLIASALIIYGILDDHRPILLIGMFLALLAAGVGDRWRKRRE